MQWCEGVKKVQINKTNYVSVSFIYAQIIEQDGGRQKCSTFRILGASTKSTL